MPESDETGLGNLTRRACLRLTILAATGLALFPGCNRSRSVAPAAGAPSPASAATPPAPAASAEKAGGGSLLDRWAHLGRIWRAIGAQQKVSPGAHTAARPAFENLKTEMAQALDALSASAPLRALFEERWQHVFLLQYGGSCYGPSGAGDPRPAREAVEKQVQELEKLVAEGKVTEKAAGDAARVLAVQAEYLERVRDTMKPGYNEQTMAKLKQIWDDYRGKKIAPRSGATLAGKRATELTVDKVGMLAGPPKEKEDLDEGAAPAGGQEGGAK